MMFQGLLYAPHVLLRKEVLRGWLESSVDETIWQGGTLSLAQVEAVVATIVSLLARGQCNLGLAEVQEFDLGSELCGLAR